MEVNYKRIKKLRAEIVKRRSLPREEIDARAAPRECKYCDDHRQDGWDEGYSAGFSNGLKRALKVLRIPEESDG